MKIRYNSKVDRLKVFEALIEYANSQKKSISLVIEEFLPDIMYSPRIEGDGMKNKLDELEKRIAKIEFKLEQSEKNIDQKIQLKAQEIFWKSLGIIALIVGLITGLYKFFHQ